MSASDQVYGELFENALTVADGESLPVYAQVTATLAVANRLDRIVGLLEDQVTMQKCDHDLKWADFPTHGCVGR